MPTRARQPATTRRLSPNKRNRPLLNLVKNNPLAGGLEKGDGTAKHLPGLGKHPVRDIVKKCPRRRRQGEGASC